MIWLAVIVVMVLALTGLAVDLGYVRTTEQELQTAADAAAMAAARLIMSEVDPSDPGNPFSVTRQAAINIALDNKAASSMVQLDANAANTAEGDIVLGRWNNAVGEFTPDTLTPDAVKVVARRTTGSTGGALDLWFGPIFGQDYQDVERTAIAQISLGDPLILVLHPNKAGSMRLNGDPVMNAMVGIVQVNSANNCGLLISGSTALLSARQTRVTGGACSQEGTIIGEVREGVPPVPDPMAWLLPDVPAWNAFRNGLPEPLGPTGQINASGTYTAGHYPEGLDIASSMVVTLQAGQYVFGGDGIKITGSAMVYGTGITMLIDKSGDLQIGGSEAGMIVSPPTTGMFQGVTLFHHRLNSGPKICDIQGFGTFDMGGLLYVPSGLVQIGGTPGKLIGAIICNELRAVGTTGFTITGKLTPYLNNIVVLVE